MILSSRCRQAAVAFTKRRSCSTWSFRYCWVWNLKLYFVGIKSGSIKIEFDSLPILQGRMEVTVSDRHLTIRICFSSKSAQICHFPEHFLWIKFQKTDSRQTSMTMFQLNKTQVSQSISFWICFLFFPHASWCASWSMQIDVSQGMGFFALGRSFLASTYPTLTR